MIVHGKEATAATPSPTLRNVTAWSALWLVAFAVAMRAGAPLVGLGVASGAAVAFGLRPGALRPRLLPVVPASLVGPGAQLVRPGARIALGLAVGLGVGAVTLAGTYLLWPVLRGLYPPMVDDVRQLYASIPVTPVTLPVVVLVVVAEELLWRGCLVTGERSTLHLRAIVLVTLLYAGAQAGSGLPLLGAAGLLLGGVWAAEAIWTGSLLAPLVSHAIWTLAVFWVAPLDV